MYLIMIMKHLALMAYGKADEVLGDFYPDIESPYFIGPGRPRALSINLNYQF